MSTSTGRCALTPIASGTHLISVDVVLFIEVETMSMQSTGRPSMNRPLEVYKVDDKIWLIDG